MFDSAKTKAALRAPVYKKARPVLPFILKRGSRPFFPCALMTGRTQRNQSANDFVGRPKICAS
ncbi:MAG: hypothetical protein WCK17_04725 [Verrucomicrobiota bacterium]